MRSSSYLKNVFFRSSDLMMINIHRMQIGTMMKNCPVKHRQPSILSRRTIIWAMDVRTCLGGSADRWKALWASIRGFVEVINKSRTSLSTIVRVNVDRSQFSTKRVRTIVRSPRTRKSIPVNGNPFPTMLIKILNMSNRDYVVKQLFRFRQIIARDILMISVGRDYHRTVRMLIHCCHQQIISNRRIWNIPLPSINRPSMKRSFRQQQRQCQKHQSMKVSKPSNDASRRSKIRKPRKRLGTDWDPLPVDYPLFPFSSAILIAFIVTWLPYNTNIIISTIKPDIFNHGFPMYWERFGYMLCYVNSTIK